MRRCRILFIFAVLLVLGQNVLIAIMSGGAGVSLSSPSIVEWPTSSGNMWLTRNDPSIYIDSQTILGSLWVDLTGNAPIGSTVVLIAPESPMASESWVDSSEVNFSLPEPLLKRHSIDDYASLNPKPEYIRSTRVGLPFKSFCSLVDQVKQEDGSYKYRRSFGISISGRFMPWLPNATSRAIPLRPIFLGFVLNTAVAFLFLFVVKWGARNAWWLVRLPFIRRKSRGKAERRKRAECVDCGYSIDGIERCPECGLVVETD